MYVLFFFQFRIYFSYEILYLTNFFLKYFSKIHGTVGAAGSLWSVNNLGLMYATEGHDPPEGPFYDLQCDSFTSNDDFEMIPA